MDKKPDQYGFVKIDKNTWEHKAKAYDATITQDKDVFMLDVFDGKIKDPDDAHLESNQFDTYEDAAGYFNKEYIDKKTTGKMTKIRTFESFDINEAAISKEYIERMEGLANTKNLKQFNELLESLTKEWLDEGFELSDVLDYIDHKMDRIGFKK